MVKYKQIAQEITDYIVNNNLQQHDQLPVIDDLAQSFNSSKSTIIRALDILEAKGQIYQVQGSGTFVRDIILPGFINLNRPEGLTQTLIGSDIETRVMSVSIIKPDATMIENLRCGPNEDVYLVKRMRYLAGQPIVYEVSYYRKKYVIFLNKEIAADSIFKYLRENLNIKPGFSNSYFEVSPMDEEIAGYLEVAPEEYGIKLINQFFLPNGATFDYSILWYHKDRSKFFVPSTYY